MAEGAGWNRRPTTALRREPTSVSVDTPWQPTGAPSAAESAKGPYFRIEGELHPSALNSNPIRVTSTSKGSAKRLAPTATR